MSDLDWEPENDERSYYRHARTGDLGYLVRKDGKDCIRLDRPMEELYQPMTDAWVREDEHVPFSRFQVATVAWDADKALCRILGQHVEARSEWSSQSDKERIYFMARGPCEKHGKDLKQVGGLRSELYKTIMGLLGPMAR